MKTPIKKQFKLFSVGFIVFSVVASGLYNSVVMNSSDFMNKSDIRFVKRLDEVYGVVKVGRIVANQGSWVKLESPKQEQIINAVASSVVSEKSESFESTIPEAAIKEDLQLELVEVFNAQKYKVQPTKSEFSGSLNTKDGLIESLEASLPKGETIAISLSEMNGNVFEYESQGQMFAGMFYELDKSSYMVTLTNGPYEGTRLKFSKPQEEAEYVSDVVADNSNDNSNEFGNNEENNTYTQNSQVGVFGSEPVQAEEMVSEVENVEASEDSQVSYGFDFNAGNQESQI